MMQGGDMHLSAPMNNRTWAFLIQLLIVAVMTASLLAAAKCGTSAGPHQNEGSQCNYALDCLTNFWEEHDDAP